MSKVFRLVTVVFVFGMLHESALADGILPATDAPKPMTPEESRKAFRLPEGFRIELAAAEPLLAEPTGVCFDAKGRMFVCEIHGYNRDGYYDILELNKTGVLDKAVRRIPASKEAQALAAKETYGTVRMLESTKGDGRYDKSTVVADRLPPCYGMVPARDGIIVLCAPDILFLADRDGDGKAEVREALYTGFGVGEIWTNISNPRWGVDNWIYAATGSTSAGTITGPHMKGEVRLGRTSFRFKADGSRLEPVTGYSAGFGLSIDDWGDRYLVSNQQHALYVTPLPHQALARNPYAPAVAGTTNISSYGLPARVYPTSPSDPWRRRRGETPEWIKFYGVKETSAGLMTSACSPMHLQSDLFPPDYRGNLFACEPSQNLVHRCILEPKGAGYAAKRAEEGRDFLTSSDSWFRPVSLAVGPDGAMYVVDMYREIIEDYSAIPRFLQQQYVEGLRNGIDKGRIWRILSDDPPKDRTANLAALDAAGLVAELGSPVAWRRLTAQRLLVERSDKSAVPQLKTLCTSGKTPQSRLHALHALDGMGALDSTQVERSLGDENQGVRLNAVQLGERWLDKEPGLFEKVRAMSSDSNPKVRLQVAVSLGESQNPAVLPELARLALRDGEDPWMRAAIVSAVPTRSVDLIALLLKAKRKAESTALLARQLASVAGARKEGVEIAGLLRFVKPLEADDPASSQILTGLLEGLGRGDPQPSVSDAEMKALEALLIETSPEVKKLAFRIAGAMNMTQSAAIQRVRSAALETAKDGGKTLKDRLEALGSLVGASQAELKALRDLLNPREPLELQLEAVKALVPADGPGASSFILEGWKEYTPRVQTMILDSLCARRDRLPMLLDAIEKKVVDKTSLPDARRTQLLENPDSRIRNRAKALFAGRTVTADRKEILEKYKQSLSLKPDIARGKAVFELQCQKCHQLNGAGFAVGPDLAAAQNRPDESLLIDILDPGSTITVGFKSFQVAATNGKVYTGVLAEETATSITLKREKGEQDVILRRDIESMVASAKSPMPEGLEKEINPQDMANLIGFLRESLKSASAKATLFEDDPAFVRSMNQGKGKISLNAEDKFSGAASLQVAGTERFSPRLPGWKYVIAEKPAPGEYRYLRLAWKTPDGAGVLVELANDGKWPPAKDPKCRIYSGRNTTPWAATRIAEEAPRKWTVVTVDLWKEFGKVTLTGLGVMPMDGAALIDKIELLRELDEK